MKKMIFKTTVESSFGNEVTMTALRVVAGLLMASLHGFGKMPPSTQLIDGVGALGFPMPELFAWAASLAELVGGVFLALGLFTRPSALFLSVTMFVAAFGAHLKDPLQTKELSLLYLFIALIFVFRGGNKVSVDNLIK